MVATLTVKDTGAFASISVNGFVEHVEFAGAPVHVSVTVPVNPFTGLISRLNVAVCPALNVADVELPGAALILRSLVVPIKGADCGLPAALSLTVRFPFRVPVALGVNETSILQLEPAASIPPVIGHVVTLIAKSLLSAPLIAIPEIVRVALPGLLSTIVCPALVVPAVWPLNERLAGARELAGIPTIVSVAMAEFEPRNPRLPLNMADSVCRPGIKLPVAKLACPDESKFAIPICVPLSMKATLPEVTGLPPTVTVAVIVTSWPTRELGDERVMLVWVAAAGAAMLLRKM